MAKESFEVYYYQSGRWQLHASYEADDRDKALEEARTVQAKTSYPTRVIRETFSPETNTSEEIISWQSPKAKAIGDADTMFGPKPKAPPPKKQAPPPPRPAPETEKPRPQPKPQAKPKPKPKKPKPKSEKRGGFMRFVMAFAISFGLAGVLAIATALAVAQMPGLGLSNVDANQLVTGTFVLLFFIALAINLQREFNILAILRGSGGKKKAAAGPAKMMATAAQAKKPQFTQDVDISQVEIDTLREEIAAEDEEAGGGDEGPTELDADMDAEVSEAPDSEAEPESVPQPSPAVEAQAAPEVKQPEPRTEAKPPPPPKPAEPQKSPGEIEARGIFSRFVSDTMNTMQSEQLNTFSRFGVNLYFAGAASIAGQAKRLARDAQLAMLKDGLEIAGSTPERAESFCIELPNHGKNPRYAGMIQAGVKAMNGHIAGRHDSATLRALLADWNLPEKRPNVPSVYTFVFTDIVGSTAMTQKLGNAGAQKAVRAHNNAVRNAIKAKGGHEVKHTGDGIMATFPDPASAVAATIQMQREVAAHNSANPTIEVGVRIGVNVGEAVAEENDFFGAAVQMTARICDKASKGNIWVSQAVVEACKGQRIGFIPRGQFEMKGIQGKKILYEVGWSDAHKNELADL